MSHALTALWAKCDMRAHTINNELGDLDFNVATNSQGLGVKSFTVKTLSRDAWHASVVANLTPDNWVRHSDRENGIRYDLVWQGGRWAIDDIHSVIEPNPWSLRTSHANDHGPRKRSRHRRPADSCRLQDRALPDALQHLA